jgi:hypothetical protein
MGGGQWSLKTCSLTHAFGEHHHTQLATQVLGGMARTPLCDHAADWQQQQQQHKHPQTTHNVAPSECIMVYS